MTQLNTQLIREGAGPWVDNVDMPWVTISATPDNVYKQEYDHITGNDTPNTYETPARVLNSNSVTFANGDSVDFVTGVYTFADNQPNRFQTPSITPTPSANVDTKMGEDVFREDVATGIKKYFAEAFSFDANKFEMDGDRVVGLKQSFIDSLVTDLTNIVNTSIRTTILEADNATINDTLTALGIDVTGLLTAKGLDVGVDGLTIEGTQGHKYRLHLGN